MTPKDVAQDMEEREVEFFDGNALVSGQFIHDRRQGTVLLALKIGSIRDSTEPRALATMRYEEK